MTSAPEVANVWHASPADRMRPQRLSPVPLVRMVEHMTCRDAAAFLGVNTGTLQKWRNGETAQGLHYAKADMIACRNLGVHPSTIWGQEWWQL